MEVGSFIITADNGTALQYRPDPDSSSMTWLASGTITWKLNRYPSYDYRGTPWYYVETEGMKGWVSGYSGYVG